MKERYILENCWRYDLEGEIRIFRNNGYDNLNTAIEMASNEGFDTVVTIIPGVE